MIDLSSDTFDAWRAEVLDASQDGLVVAYFTAPWCVPCKLLRPRLEELEFEYAGALTTVRVDADTNRGLAREFRIMSVPTLMFYSAGYQVAVVNGAKPKGELREIIVKYL